jgi:hypothetical protein
MAPAKKHSPMISHSVESLIVIQNIVLYNCHTLGQSRNLILNASTRSNVCNHFASTMQERRMLFRPVFIACLSPGIPLSGCNALQLHLHRSQSKQDCAKIVTMNMESYS